MGNRKIKIIPNTDDSTLRLIDGKQSYIIEVPYGAVQLICRDSNWWIV